jgi:hypothetical protein
MGTSENVLGYVVIERSIGTGRTRLWTWYGGQIYTDKNDAVLKAENGNSHFFQGPELTDRYTIARVVEDLERET